VISSNVATIIAEPVSGYGEAATESSERQRAGGSTRLAVTSRAPELRRLHLARDAARVAVLFGSDTAALALLWLTLRGTAGVPGGVAISHYIPAVLLGLMLFGCYDSGDKRRQLDSLVKAAGLGAIIPLWAINLGSPAVWLTAAGILWLSTALVLLFERRIVDLLVRVTRPGDKQVMRAAVVGPTESAARMIDHPAFADAQWCRLDAFLDPRRVPGDVPAALARLIRDRQIDTVILTGNLSNPVFEQVLDVAGASGCRVFSLPRVPPSTTCLPEVAWRNGFPVVELTRPSVMGTQLLVKRATDLLLSSLALLAVSPIMIVLAILVKRSSPGPVFFRQVRIGLGGRRFTIFKFRTMVQGADQQREQLQAQSLYSDGRLFKIVNDPRVTPLGAFLRRTSLDELPQLLNVLRGDMSLVGPRPPLPSEVELYQAHHYTRFDVKPGITGPWQVSGRNSIHDFDTVIRLESAYIRRWSLWLDLELLCRTVPVVLSGRGAH
jgi:exopolysaccharide biosynthesis polyprenyl glycosylphosphotransferase